MKNLNQKKKREREKAISCCENVFFLNVQFFPLRFPQNIPLKGNRHLQNVALASLQEKHVDFGRTQQVAKTLCLSSVPVLWVPYQVQKKMTILRPVIRCKSLLLINSLKIYFSKEIQTSLSQQSHEKKKALKKIISAFIYFWLCQVFATCTGFFSSCRGWGLLSSSSARASHCGGFCCCRAEALGHLGSALPASRAQAQQLWHTGLVAPRILLDQGLNPCLPHWQAGSYLLSHQGRPSNSIF